MAYLAVAVKRGKSIVPNWIDTLETIQGIKLISDSNNQKRVLIETTPENIDCVRVALGNDFWLEPIIIFSPYL